MTMGIVSKGNGNNTARLPAVLLRDTSLQLEMLSGEILNGICSEVRDMDIRSVTVVPWVVTLDVANGACCCAVGVTI